MISSEPLLALLQANNLLAYQINAGDNLAAVFSTTKTASTQSTYS
jgi:hypothetical protein